MSTRNDRYTFKFAIESANKNLKDNLQLESNKKQLKVCQSVKNIKVEREYFIKKA